MADLYQHDPHKFALAGLQLRVPPDLVPANEYVRVTNGIPIIEGRIEGRAGLKFLVNVADTTSPGSGLHSLTRLNQPSTAGVGDRIAGIDTTVQTFALPAGNVATSRDTSRTGDPLSLPTFHFNADTSAWQVIADRFSMRKYKGGPGGGLYVPLGIAAPNSQLNSRATAVDGGAGNLSNGSGPGYDWVYTYVNPTTLSESNPSDTNLGVPDYTTSSTVGTTPDPNYGGAAGSGVVGGTGTLSANSAAETRQSALWTAWAAGGPFQVPLVIHLSITIDPTTNPGTTGGCAFGAITMSLDGGSSWKLITDELVHFAAGSYNIVIVLPVTQDLTQLQIRAVALGIGNTTIPQNVTARRIRDRAGNYNVTDLLTGGGGNALLKFTITNMSVEGWNIADAVSTLPLANRKANVSVLQPLDTQVKYYNLYRRGGAVTASWAFVQQFAVLGHNPNTSDVLVDNIADGNLGQFVTLTNDAPVTSIFVQQRPLPYIWGPAFNPSRLLGCGDPDRPDAVYFSNPGNADQWASTSWIDVSSPTDQMQNGCVFNTRVFAFSKERMFELIQGLLGATTLTPFETPCRRGLISPWGLLSTARAVYFVAKDGIYSTDGGPEQSLVENNIKPLFPTLDNPLGRQVEDCDAVNMERIEDIRLRFHNDELYFTYRGLNSGNLQTLVYDQNKDRWRRANYPVGITTIYSEEAGPASSLLLGDSTGSLYSTASGTGDVLQASTPDISVEIRTGAFDQGIPLNQKEYGNVLIDIDPGGATVFKPVTITPYLNGEVVVGAAVTVTGTGRQQVPLSLGDVFGFNLSFGITFSKNATINPVLFQFDILYRLEPVQVSHFETRELSYGMPGFGHARDAYVAVRSTSPITLTMTFDGTAQTYTIPSTSNLRRKTYVPFISNKGKLYKFSLDTSDGSGFRVYQEDSEVRFKPWITSLGYQVTRALGAEAPMVTQAFESQLLGR